MVPFPSQSEESPAGRADNYIIYEFGHIVKKLPEAQTMQGLTETGLMGIIRPEE
jgi:hypothetical protein